MKRLLAVVALLGVAVAAAAAAYGYQLLQPAAENAEAQVYEVPRGAGLSRVARELEARGIVKSALALRALARYRGVESKLHAGEYDLSPEWPARVILSRLTTGRVRTYALVIPEGLRASEIAQRLEAQEIVSASDFMALVNDPALVLELGLEGDTLEGYLFPETYRFAKAQPARQVIEGFVRQFDAAWARVEDDAAKRNMSMREVVTLASIVEKETGAAEERPLIAAVFHNRLRRGMRLETDPSVIYGIPDFDGNLRRVHLRDASNPYNTYKIPGLPPGPIANPGLDSLRAVVDPADSEYLYFVSRNDGTHFFSTNYRDHSNAVNRFQKEETLPMTVPDAHTFYTERIPAQWNRTLAQQRDAADSRVYESMKAVSTTLRAIVEGEGGGTFHMNVEHGEMTIGESATHAPFLTLVHDAESLGPLVRESGDSVLGFLGALAGLRDEIKLTQQRVENLEGVEGSLRFVLSGDDGFALIAHFGPDPIPSEPTCTLSVTPEAYQQLRSGALNPQEAFLGGQVQLEGDMQMAMQIALAAVSPD